MPDLDLDDIMAEHCDHHDVHYIDDLDLNCCACMLPEFGNRTCLPYLLAKRARDAEAKVADAWDEGFTKAGRLIMGLDKEPWPPAPNPYRAALGGDHEQPKPEGNLGPSGVGCFSPANHGGQS